MFLALSPGSKSDQQESIVMKRQFDSWWNSSSWRLQIRNFWMVWVSRLIFPPLIWLLDKRGEGGYRQLMLRRSEVAVKGQEVNDGWDVALSTSWEEEEERCLTHCCYGNLDRVCVHERPTLPSQWGGCVTLGQTAVTFTAMLRQRHRWTNEGDRRVKDGSARRRCDDTNKLSL